MIDGEIPASSFTSDISSLVDAEAKYKIHLVSNIIFEIIFFIASCTFVWHQLWAPLIISIMVVGFCAVQLIVSKKAYLNVRKNFRKKYPEASKIINID